MASELSEKILTYLDVKGETNTIVLSNEFKTDHQRVIGAINSLISLGNLITTEPETHNLWELSEEGNSVAQKGSHEAATFYAIPEEGLPLKKLKTVLPDKNLNSIGFSKAMANGWLVVDKSGAEPTIKKKVAVINDSVCQHLKMVGTPEFDNLAESVRQDYKKRKLVSEITVKSYRIKKGTDFRTSISKGETDLTHEMIANGTWKEMSFKPYNFDALGVPPERGHLHPLMKVKAEVKQIFLEMGFTEMPTNNYVESSFWNFDALYVPQQHPARDDHDTFFISDPQVTKKFPDDCLGKVKDAHEIGGYGSVGYRYDWKLEEAEKNVLRTHTTAVSARMLYKLAHEGFKPVKYFSIDKVFRNETLDATHLAEFHQVEGVLADYNLTLGDLMGVIEAFFKKLGMKEIRFKPTYNPYTEPSMEAYSYHEGLGKWIEIGNSGLFRPELLRPLGIPENVNVLGYGLSLERPTMIRYGINNIRDLVGPKVDLQMVYDNPLCRMEKNTSQQHSSLQDVEKQWDKIHMELKKLKIQVKSLLDQETGNRSNNITSEPHQEFSSSEGQKIEIEIVCPLKFPGYSLLILIKKLTKVFKTRLSLNADIKNLPNELANFFCMHSTKNNFTSEVDIKFIITSDICEASLKLPLKNVEIVGEVNVARYLNRLLESKSDSAIAYESSSLLQSCEIDIWLDRLYLASKKRSKLTDIIQLAESHLERKKWLVGNIATLADICLWSFLKQSKSGPKLPKQIELWLHNCNAYCDL